MPLQAAVDAVLQRERREHLARGIHQSRVDRADRIGRTERKQGIEVAIQRLALLGTQATRVVDVPIDPYPGLQAVRVELGRRVEHEVVFQGLVSLLQVLLVAGAQALLQAARDTWQQRIFEQSAVRYLRSGIELVALIKTERAPQRRIGQRKVRRLGSAAHRHQHRGQRRHVA